MGSSSSSPKTITIKKKVLGNIRHNPVVYLKSDAEWIPAAQQLESILVQQMCTITMEVEINESNFYSQTSGYHLPVEFFQSPDFKVAHAYLASNHFLEALKHVFHTFENVNVNVVAHSDLQWNMSLSGQLTLNEKSQSLSLIDAKIQEIAAKSFINIPETNVQIRLLTGNGRKSLYASGLICESVSSTVSRSEANLYDDAKWQKMENQLQQWKKEQTEQDEDLRARLQAFSNF